MALFHQYDMMIHGLQGGGGDGKIFVGTGMGMKLWGLFGDGKKSTRIWLGILVWEKINGVEVGMGTIYFTASLSSSCSYSHDFVLTAGLSSMPFPLMLKSNSCCFPVCLR